MAFRSYTALAPTTATVVYTADPGDVEVWIQPTQYTHITVVGTPSQGGGVTLQAADDPVSEGTRRSGEIFHSRVRPGDVIYVQGNSTTGVQIMVRSA